MASKGLAVLAPNGVNFTKAWQSKVSPRLGSVLSGLSSALGETVNVNSGYRSPEYNRAVKGAKNSLHMKGLAADIDMQGWSVAKRQQAIQALAKLGVGGFITYENSPNMLHIDMRPQVNGVPHFMFDKYGANMKNAPGWFQSMAASFKPQGPIQRQLPSEMMQPSEMTRAQALSSPTGLTAAQQKLANALTTMGTSKQVAAQMARQASIASAYNDPSRRQDVVSASRKPTASDLLGLTVGLDRPNPAARPGLNMPAGPTRPSVPTSYPGRPASAASAVAGGFAAPVGQVTRAPLGPALSRPSAPPSNFAKGMSAAPTAGYEPTRQAAGTPIAGYAPKAQPAGTPTAGYNPASPSNAELTAQHQSYRSPTRYAGVKNQIANNLAYAEYEANRAKAFSAMPAPGLLPAASIPPTVPAATPPALAMPPAAVLAPALAPPRTVSNMSVAGIPAAPRATAADVYSGLADQGVDSVGNQIGRVSNGTTTVTNQYGATTGMTPGGYQTAVGSLPGIGGPSEAKQKSGGLFSGIDAEKAKAMGTSAALSIAGGAIAGPAGAIAGGLLGRALASRRGGVLSGIKNIDTSNIGSITLGNQTFAFGPQTQFYRPDSSLRSFPGAPASGGYTGSPSFSNRSGEGMRGISPGAAAAIGRGQGGLY